MLRIEQSTPFFLAEYFATHQVWLLQLLDEMLDNGFPLATELNILQELIKPPKWYRSIANTVTGKTK